MSTACGWSPPRWPMLSLRLISVAALRCPFHSSRPLQRLHSAPPPAVRFSRLAGLDWASGLAALLQTWQQSWQLIQLIHCSPAPLLQQRPACPSTCVSHASETKSVDGGVTVLAISGHQRKRSVPFEPAALHTPTSLPVRLGTCPVQPDLWKCSPTAGQARHKHLFSRDQEEDPGFQRYPCLAGISGASEDSNPAEILGASA